MIQVTIAEAQQRLPELLATVEAGQVVTIRGERGQSFTLTTLTAQPGAPLVNPEWLAIRTRAAPKD